MNYVKTYLRGPTWPSLLRTAMLAAVAVRYKCCRFHRIAQHECPALILLSKPRTTSKGGYKSDVMPTYVLLSGPPSFLSVAELSNFKIARS